MRQYKIAYRKRGSHDGFTLKTESQTDPVAVRAEMLHRARLSPAYEYILVEVLATVSVDVKVVDL